MPEQVLFIRAAFWNSDEDEHPAEALVTVEDAAVVIFSRDDGLQLRLTIAEFTGIAQFVVEEVERQEGEEGNDRVCYAPC